MPIDARGDGSRFSRGAHNDIQSQPQGNTIVPTCAVDGTDPLTYMPIRHGVNYFEM